MSRDQDDAGTAHTVTGTETETVVECPQTGHQYGPGAQPETSANWCPYCSADVKDEDHRVARRFSEVFCDRTPMSSWRYCPGCGEEVDHDQ